MEEATVELEGCTKFTSKESYKAAALFVAAKLLSNQSSLLVQVLK